MDSSYVLFVVLLFVAVVAAFEGLYQLWASKNSAEARRVAARLRDIEGALQPLAQASIERHTDPGRLPWLSEALLKLPGGTGLHGRVRASGTGRSPGELAAASLLLAAVGAAVPWVWSKPWVFSVLGAAVLGVLPWLWVNRRAAQRIQRFERQIPEALDLMSRALRAGHAFPTAVKMVGDEMQDPIAQDFRQLFEETNFGIPQNEALLRLAARVPIDDLRYFVIAVMIQRESGGNLAELLDNIANIVRARLKLLGEVRTLSAEGRLSAWILGALPFCVAAVVQLVNPGFMAVLWTDPIGLRMVGGALTLMVLGVWWMRKIIHIRV
jgi:tight adherence protein B